MAKRGTVPGALLVLSLVACARTATRDEVAEACARRAGLAKAADPTPPAGDPVAKVVDEYQRRIQELQDQGLRGLDAGMQRKVAEGRTDRNALGREYWSDKTANDRAIEPLLRVVKAERDQAVKAARDAAARADRDVAERAAAGLAACTDRAIGDRTTRAKVDCQRKATSLAGFDACR